MEAVYILFKYERNDHLEEALLKALCSPGPYLLFSSSADIFNTARHLETLV